MNLEMKEQKLNGAFIDKWKVWFQTPIGLFEEIKHAIVQCEENDWNPETMITPVAVAVNVRKEYHVYEKEVPPMRDGVGEVDLSEVSEKESGGGGDSKKNDPGKMSLQDVACHMSEGNRGSTKKDF